MDSGLYTATSGMIAEYQRLQVIANNIANADTAGFKTDRTFFELVRGAMARAPHGDAPIRANDQTLAAGTRFDPLSGSLRQTGNPFDVAVEGDGYFMVGTPGGVKYTRDGGFRLAGDGTLVNASGLAALDPNGNTMRIDLAAGGAAGGRSNDTGGPIVIDEAGRIFRGEQELGQLGLRDFPQAQARLRKVGDALFAPVRADDSGEATVSRVRQGHLEGSNVNILREMAEMIESQRAFESYQKIVVSIANDMDRKAATELGSIA
ncbi:MAG: flagellar hook basal-body protein [Candidatus Schekmanbacteria bacterium]|nr:flagellar hook basal-body protein [Candidatus Schekmanbacteria bacterium]